ncbi:MAG: YbaB/EbfC family nucleoid-associated protein [Saprospiraceae bacterium]
MFGDMMSQMQQQQEALQAKLAAMRITETTDGIAVTVSGTREVVNVKIDESIMADGDAEQVEDLLLIALNRALEKAGEVEKTEAQSLMSGMMPGGMPDMGSLFGK